MASPADFESIKSQQGRCQRFYTVWAGSSPSLPDGSNPSAAIVQSASDVQCSRLLKTTARPSKRMKSSAEKSFSKTKSG
ncbi:hypothetical protein APA39_32140 [Pseudomonas aeruginosa]|nr:hypothetical protein EGY26_13805 [Pseudomonas aeruginosa]OPE05252.1 hypothetical protein APA39_32140 [Pseudomonas aeruginosa]OPE21061.1 hypothetical protein APA95_31700 [Pseudomonas aeruginosa]